MENNQLLIAKIEDKIRTSKTQNKITNTEFLNESQIAFSKKELVKQKENRYFFFGGYEEATRKILIIYPEKIEKEEVIKNINNIVTGIKVQVPNEIYGKLEHKNYLGTIMSFGLTRERIGDIIVYENKAYIIVLKENAEYIKNELKQEKRFKKAEIEIIDINKIEPKPIEFEGFSISVNSLRLDNIISEILKTSRKIAQEQIEQERVFINYEIATKNTKILKEKDILTIRGKGKYIIEKLLGKNKKRKRNHTNKKIYVKHLKSKYCFLDLKLKKW